MKIYLKVKPNSVNSCILDLGDNHYLAELKSPADKNKANLELVKLLSKKFKVEPKRIVIKAGLTNKNKLIEINQE